jgi:GTPase SAR1 family protein
LHAQIVEHLAHSLDWEPSVWLDERTLNTEADLESQIRAGLRDSAVIVIVASETVESRKWCRDEMGWYLTGVNLHHVPVQRMYPIFLPSSDIENLPRWVRHLSDPYPIVLHPERKELFADQDLSAHGTYWHQLYGWISRLSDG